MNAHEPIAVCRSDLPWSSWEELVVLNSLYSSAGFEHGQIIWRWERTRAEPVDHWVQFECGNELLWLGVIAATLNAAVDYSWRDHSGTAREIAWCASYPQILETAQQLFQRDWVPTDIRLDLGLDRKSVDAGFVIERAGENIASGLCRLNADRQPRIDAADDRAPARVMRQLPFVIPVVVDRASLTVDELRKIEIGAVIRINRRAFLDIGAPLRLSAGNTDFLVNVTGTTLTVLDVAIGGAAAEINLEGKMVTNDNQLHQECGDRDDNDEFSTAPVDVAGMPVDVRFESGRIVTRYDQLCRIQPGYTYELGATLGEQSIDIIANGVLIARGELVNIGDQLGVRVTALARAMQVTG